MIFFEIPIILIVIFVIGIMGVVAEEAYAVAIIAAVIVGLAEIINFFVAEAPATINENHKHGACIFAYISTIIKAGINVAFTYLLFLNPAKEIEEGALISPIIHMCIYAFLTFIVICVSFLLTVSIWTNEKNKKFSDGQIIAKSFLSIGLSILGLIASVIVVNFIFF